MSKIRHGWRYESVNMSLGWGICREFDLKSPSGALPAEPLANERMSASRVRKMPGNVNFVRMRDISVVVKDACRVRWHVLRFRYRHKRESSPWTEFRKLAPSYCFMYFEITSLTSGTCCNCFTSSFESGETPMKCYQNVCQAHLPKPNVFHDRIIHEFPDRVIRVWTALHVQ